MNRRELITLLAGARAAARRARAVVGMTVPPQLYIFADEVIE